MPDLHNVAGSIPNDLFEHLRVAAARLRDLTPGVNGAQGQLQFTPYPSENRHTQLGKEFQEARELAGKHRGIHHKYLGQAEVNNNLAAHSSVHNIKHYMNPYQEHVTKRIEELGNRNLRNNILPALEAKFVRLGQHGGKRHAEMAERAARDIQSEISAQQAQALHGGYGQATQLANQDLQRQLEIAHQRAMFGKMAQAGNFADIEQLMQFEESQRQNEQALKELKYQEFLRELMHPTERMQMYANFLHGLPTSTPQYYYQPQRESMNRRGWQNVLGKGLASWAQDKFG
jgi:hypothetical protein